jgi:DNA-binding transcriptional MocR family regulator
MNRPMEPSVVGSSAASHREPAYAGRVARMGASEIRELLKVLEQPDVLSFAGGMSHNLVRKVVLAKQAADLHAATLNQMLIHRVASAVHDARIPKLVAAHAARRDAMLAALKAYMPAGVRWTCPEGGMFVWVTLPDGVDSGNLLRLALAEAKVAFVPGAAFFTDGQGRNTLRLSYALQPETTIREGMRRLGLLVSRLVPQPQVCA